MPLSYTNRKGKTHYFRAVKTKKGGVRYYITKSPDFPNLLEEVPEGFEIVELPEEARVILRKIIPCLITEEEKYILHQAIEKYSAVEDFFIWAEKDTLSVYVSQFNSATGQHENASPEEIKEYYGKNVDKWKRYSDYLRFILVDEKERIFKAERVVFLSLFGYDFYGIGNS